MSILYCAAVSLRCGQPRARQSAFTASDLFVWEHGSTKDVHANTEAPSMKILAV